MTIRFENDRRTRAEQRVLGALLRDAGSLRHCEQLQPADFSHDLHGAIFAAVRLLLDHDHAVSAASVLGVLRIGRRAPRFEVFPYLLYLACVVEAIPAHSGYYAAAMFDELTPAERQAYDGAGRGGTCRACEVLGHGSLARAYDAIGRAYGVVPL